MSDVPKDTAPPSDNPPTAPLSEKLEPPGVAAMQGQELSSPAKEVLNPSRKGSDFETWASQNIFRGEGRRLTIHSEDNPQLDKIGDGVGITKDRRVTDVYLAADGAIWELKSGYEKGGLDRDQLFEYSLMEQAGYVYAREGDKVTKAPVTSVNYLFETETAARANEPYLRGQAAPWYVDKEGKLQLLEGYEKKQA